jgi:hypothetical protein
MNNNNKNNNSDNNWLGGVSYVEMHSPGKNKAMFLVLVLVLEPVSCHLDAKGDL